MSAAPPRAAAGAAGAPRPDLDAILDRAGAPLKEALERVERRLAEIARAWPGPLADQAVATIAAGGKRLRPLLVLLAAAAARCNPEGEAVRSDAVVRAAAAVELVHSASLVHDDVLDRASLRRGQPTVVAAAGRRAATAAGDLLFSRAFAELARNDDVEQLRTLSQASTALASGELMQRADAYRTGMAVERYLHRCELKTASLFEAACRLGVLAAAGGGELAAGVGRYARALGLAFQILDDVLDVSGPASRTGKQPGTDLLDGTVTLPLILARERDPGLATLDLRGLTGPEDAARVCDQIAVTGALRQSRQRALAIVAEAKAALPAQLAERERGLLELVADAVVERYA